MCSGTIRNLKGASVIDAGHCVIRGTALYAVQLIHKGCCIDELDRQSLECLHLRQYAALRPLVLAASCAQHGLSFKAGA